jgi:putative phosphoesterase
VTFRIGIISDTHGLLRPEAERRLAGVDHIVHGGDIGRPDIIATLRRIAPVTAIRGNVDTGDWAREFADTGFVRLAERSIFVVHDLKTLPSRPASTSSSQAIPTCRRSKWWAACST